MEETGATAQERVSADRDGALLELQGVSKGFPGVQALDGVSTELRRGEVLGVVGENGAGKSTMLKVLAGIERPDAGTYLVDGRPVHFDSHADALSSGIEIVPQEVSLVPKMSIVENICLGDYQGRLVRRAHAPAQTRRAGELAERVGLTVPLHLTAGELSLAQQRLVVVARALGRGSRVMIFDEPSVGLEEKDSNHLLEVVRALRAEGVALAYCSHNLDEIMEIADRIMVMRDGRAIWTGAASQAGHEELISMISGSEGPVREQVRPSSTGQRSLDDPVLMHVDGLRAPGFEEVSLELRRGEILGLAGLTGAGRSEVLQALFGVTHRSGGTMTVNGNPFSPNGPREAIAAGVAFMPEDRRSQGLVANMVVRSNAILARLGVARRGPVLSRPLERQIVKPHLDRWKVAPPDPDKLIGLLSGGNQQKVLLVRTVISEAEIVMLDEPTSGVDVGAREELHELVRELAAEGRGVIFVSSDLAELAGISDRALVLREGRIVAELRGSELSESRILEHCYETREQASAEGA